MGMTMFIPNFVLASEGGDTALIERVFLFGEQSLERVDSQTVNAYSKCTYRTDRRNFTLMAVPSMYEMSQGRRNYIYESYSRVTFYADGSTKRQRQVLSSTIPHYRNSMPTVKQYLGVRLYDVTLLRDFLLSPFHRANRKFYRYNALDTGGGQERLIFKPRSNNTQLVKGYAIVNTETGKIERAVIDGEYDMIRFHINTEQGDGIMNSLIAERSTISGSFSFLGNKISFKYVGDFTCPTTLPDSLDGVRDREMMNRLRPDTLTTFEQTLYREAFPEKPRQQQDSTTIVQEKKDDKKSEKKGWHIPWADIGDQLISSIKAKNERAEFRISPLINPQYLGYSHRNGISYKMRLRAEYRFGQEQVKKLKFNGTVGYNFKQHLFYFTAPLQYHYAPNERGYAEISFGNGNRISHSSIEEEIRSELPDTLAFPNDKDFTNFSDLHLSVVNHYKHSDWLKVSVGAIYHRRKAVNSEDLRLYGKPDTYFSFAPMMEIKIRPYRDAPIFTFNYERGISGILGSNMTYGKVEFDASWISKMISLRQISLRIGGGFYTDRKNVYFVDYNKFRSNNLPQSWSDDWSGQFQLLDARWYNLSPYYVRSNFTYESPMIFLSWVPLIGHYVELERFYFSNVFLDNTRPYYELGYGFTNRAFSFAAFTSFLNTQFHEFGIEFTFELFHQW